MFKHVLAAHWISWAMRPNMTVRGGFGMYAYNWSLDTYGHGMGNSFGSSGSYGDPTNGIYPVAILGGNGMQSWRVRFTMGRRRVPVPTTVYGGFPRSSPFQWPRTDYQLYHASVPKIYQWNFGVGMS